MAGLRGNQAYFVQAVQSAKGDAPTKWQDKLFFEGGSISPSHTSAQLSETDSTRNAGDFYVQQTAIEGSPAFYARPGSIQHALYFALGAKEDSGETDEGFEHVITPAAALPYVTFGRGLGGTLFEQFNDCKVSELQLSAATGSPLIATYNIMGCSSVRQSAEWSAELAPPAAETAAPYNYNNSTVELGGAETRLVSSFALTIANGVTLQQTDDSVPFDVVEGQLVVTGSFDMIFENLEEYNAYQYGSTSGTEQSSTIHTTSAKFLFERDAKNSLEFELPKVAYTDFPVSPDPSGAPITVSVKFAAQRPTFLKATVKNEVAV